MRLGFGVCYYGLYVGLVILIFRLLWVLLCVVLFFGELLFVVFHPYELTLSSLWNWKGELLQLYPSIH